MRIFQVFSDHVCLFHGNRWNSNGVIGTEFKFEIIPSGASSCTHCLTLKVSLECEVASSVSSWRLLLHRIFCLLIYAMLSPPQCRAGITVKCVSFPSRYWVCLIRHGHESHAFQIACKVQIFISPVCFSA